MSKNMGYCRFRNTLADLKDCLEHITDSLDDKDEMKARMSLVDVCQQIVSEYENEMMIFDDEEAELEDE